MKTLLIIALAVGLFLEGGFHLGQEEGSPKLTDATGQFSEFQMNYASMISFNIIDLNPKKDFHIRIESILEVLVVILICCALLVVVLTPLFLVFFWVSYSLQYVINFRDRFSMKKWLKGESDLNFESFSALVWMHYKETYSKMIGFGLAILAYAISSNLYMFKNFERMEDALFDYFSFPFTVLNSFGKFNLLKEESMVINEMWKEMLLIVGVSFLVFFIGYLLGRLIVHLRYAKLKKDWQQQVLLPPNKIIILE